MLTLKVKKISSLTQFKKKIDKHKKDLKSVVIGQNIVGSSLGDTVKGKTVDGLEVSGVTRCRTVIKFATVNNRCCFERKRKVESWFRE